MIDHTRRDFIKGAGCAALGIAAGLPWLAYGEDEFVEKARVVLIRNSEVVGTDGAINANLVQSMLDEAMVALFENPDPTECWKQIIEPSDIVGIKSNEWRHLPTPEAVEDALKRGVLGAGVAPENVAVADRVVLGHEVFKKATALINARPMRTHAWSGVGSLIKNYIMFAENPPDYHDNACAPLATLWDLPTVKGKTRLNVLVMLTPQYHTVGPHQFDDSYVWPYGGLILSTDPVAADSVGLRIIQAKRRLEFGEDRPLQPTAHHIALADSVYHLGTADPEKIDLVRIGWQEDILI